MAEVLTEPVTDFPDGVLIEIFLILPPRSLFLFRSVSKHWLRLIQNPTFTHLYMNNNLRINNQISHNPLLVMRTVKSESHRKKIVFTLLSDDETLPYQEDVPLGAISTSMASRKHCLEDDRMHLLGPCNGLFCVTDTADVVVINPATRQCRNVPRAPLSFRRKSSYRRDYVGFFDRVGFGFDHVENDYKVVWFRDAKLLEDEYSNDDEYEDDGDNYPNKAIRRNFTEQFSKSYTNHKKHDDGYPRKRRTKVEIFGLRTNRWREINSVIPAFEPSRVCSHNLFFNGAFHWLVGQDEDVFAILVFDLNNEVFKVFILPDYYQEDNGIRVYLSVRHESLGIIVHRAYYDYEIDVKFEIWIMREYGDINSWRKLYNIRFDVGIERLLSFGKKRELLVENDDGQLVSFNRKTKKSKEFEVHGLRGSVHALRYKESLVSLY